MIKTEYSTEEKIEMILIYGESGRNITNAITLYAERFPARIPSRAAFYRILKEFTTSGSVKAKKRTRRRTVTAENNEIAVLAAVAANPHISSRDVAHASGISRTSVRRILRRHKFHPYHMSMHQELHGDDFHNRLVFCQWACDQIERNPYFFRHVLFSDECTFTNHGEVNRHNMHYWSPVNPHWLREVEHQRPWSVNIWCGIMGGKLVGPYCFAGILNGQTYANFLEHELLFLLENLSLEERRIMWFQHDGCPAHFSRTAREVLDRKYHGRWIGRGSTINWPARSPDLTPPDFFLWGFLKEKVYREMPTTRENMIERITNACRDIDEDILVRCQESFARRINKCIEVGGHHFEHLME